MQDLDFGTPVRITFRQSG